METMSAPSVRNQCLAASVGMSYIVYFSNIKEISYFFVFVNSWLSNSDDSVKWIWVNLRLGITQHHFIDIRRFTITVWKNYYGSCFLDCGSVSTWSFVRKCILWMYYQNIWSQTTPTLYFDTNDGKSTNVIYPLNVKYVEKNLFSNIHFQISWLLVLFSQNIYYLYAARLLHGFVAGGVVVVAPVFLIEISSDR